MSLRFGLRLAVACFALFSASAAVFGQVKVGIVSLQKAVLDTAEIKKASADMETKYKPRQQEMEKLQKVLQAIQQQLQTTNVTPLGGSTVSVTEVPWSYDAAHVLPQSIPSGSAVMTASPLPSPVLVIVSPCTATNVAVHATDPVIVTAASAQSASPDQPTKRDPAFADAVSVTTVSIG